MHCNFLIFNRHHVLQKGILHMFCYHNLLHFSLLTEGRMVDFTIVTFHNITGFLAEFEHGMIT